MVAAPVPASKKELNRAGEFLRRLYEAEDSEAWDRVYYAIGGDRVEAALRLVERWRGLHARPLAKVNANLRYWIRKAGAEPEVTQRLKRFSTIVDKLARQPGMALARVEDVGGVRAILPRQQQILDVCEHLERARSWRIRRRRFYIDGTKPGPKADGYRAVHLIVEKDGCFVEVQLRTPGQDNWAQSVEQDTRRLRAGLKFGAGPADLRQYYVMIADYIAMRERSVEPDDWFMEDLARLYAETRAYFPPPPPRQ